MQPSCPNDPTTNPAAHPFPLSPQAELLAHMEDNTASLLEELLGTVHAFQESGTTLADIKGLSRDDLESLYEMGHGLFQQEAWDDALTAFVHLAAHDPGDIRHAFAAGMCFQQLDKPLAASIAYSQALMLDPERADIAYRLGEALVEIGQLEHAEKVLQTTHQLINEHHATYHHLQLPTENKLAELRAALNAEQHDA